MSFEERLENCANPLLRKLFSIIITKRSTLCVAADFEDFEKVVRLIEKIGEHICILKLHSGFFAANHEDKYFKLLTGYKKKYNFLLFEDRKFYDGGNTVQIEYKNMFAKYFDLVTVIPSCGDGIFKAIEGGAESLDEPRGCLAVCEVSFEGFVCPDEQKLLEIAQRNKPICVGIIGQKLQISDKYNMIKATPGINISRSSDGINQKWRSPESAVNDGTDIVIVGRGITAALESEWQSLAIQYKETSFDAYLKTLNKH